MKLHLHEDKATLCGISLAEAMAGERGTLLTDGLLSFPISAAAAMLLEKHHGGCESCAKAAQWRSEDRMGRFTWSVGVCSIRGREDPRGRRECPEHPLPPLAKGASRSRPGKRQIPLRSVLLKRIAALEAEVMIRKAENESAHELHRAECATLQRQIDTLTAEAMARQLAQQRAERRLMEAESPL